MRWILLILLLNSCTPAVEVAAPPRQPEDRTKTLTLPQKCEYLITEPDPDSWDPITETYPRNEKWEDCMGVGRK